jgi:hypothetical protein
MMGRYRASLHGCSCSCLERSRRSYRPSLADRMHSHMGSQLVLAVGMEYRLGLLTERRSHLERSFPIHASHSSMRNRLCRLGFQRPRQRRSRQRALLAKQSRLKMVLKMHQRPSFLPHPQRRES